MRKLGIILLVGIFLVGCSQTSTPEPTQPETETVIDSDALDTSSLDVLDPTEMFSDDDKDESYDTQTASMINLDSISTNTTLTGVSIDDSFVNITQAGTYILSGSTTRTIKIDVDENDKVHLVLNGVTITSEMFAAIYVYEADEVKITVAPNTVNTLANTQGFTEDGDVNVDAVIFSRQDLVINGNGTLNITAIDGNGITGKDDLKLIDVSGTLNTTNHGIEANDSIRLSDVTLSINAGNDGIQADNEEDVTLGYVYIETSNISISATHDGIQASSVLQIQSGDFKIKTFDGIDSRVDASLDESYKGIKSSGIIYLANGTYDINTADDAIHSNMDIIIDAGTYSIQTLDDALHADETLILHRPVLTVLESYEGLEAKAIEIHGGTLSITASDDGINASDGSSASPGRGSVNTDLIIQISGGLISVNAGGDGLDSNGNILMNGGELYISTQLNGADVGIDYDGNATIEGGIVVSTGSSGMAQNFENATQGSILMNLDASYTQGSRIIVSDETGTTLIDTIAMGDYSSIVLSHPSFIEGMTLTVSLDGTETNVTLDSLVSTIGSSGRRPGGR